MAEKLRFRLLTPEGEIFSCLCDAVNFTVKDNASGEGGGSLGVLPGHLPAVAALEEGGGVRCVAGGKTVFSCRVRGGFARIGREEVDILAPEVREIRRVEG
ncbi:MAG: hypothetical protein J5633_07820 [Oscillospiraceae bacterium]|nr:hypothetical protein [Oscillospiraceae bacterium]